METHAQPQPPLEDISLVLSRFQAWTGAQTANKSKDGVRELSYDEAVGRKRRHWPHATPSAPVKKAVSSPPVQTAASRREEVPRKKKLHKAKTPKTKPSSQPAKVDAAARPAPLTRQTNFRAALAETMAIVPSQAAPVALRAMQPVEHRPLTLSIRISKSEQAFLRARAQAENLSVSAYLRQCAFEVEHLRGQRHQAACSAPLQIVSPAKPGLLSRLAGLFAPRKASFTLHA